MAAPLYTTDSGFYFHAGQILILAVGLPARGKTHMSRALERYLRWIGISTNVVSLGDYRRRRLGGSKDLPPDYFTLGQKSAETEKLRKEISDECENIVWNYFKEGVQVVIYDANNGTRARRKLITDKFIKQGINVLFLESICDSDEIVEANIRSVKISSPDYAGWDPEKAVEDYWKRIKNNEKHYESVNEVDMPFIKILNVGEKIEVNEIQGYLQSRIVFFLMNIHTKYRIIYFARSGQSEVEHSYKADSDLSQAGTDYAERLKEFVVQRRASNLKARGLDPKGRRLVIWTSTRRRSNHTAWPFIRPLNAHPGQPPPGNVVKLTPRVGGSSLSESFVPEDLELPDPAMEIDENSKEAPTKEDADKTMVGVEQEKIPRGDPYDLTPSQVKVIEKQQMSEINPGVWDGYTAAEIKARFPDEWENFMKDPYGSRARRAESYHDLSIRLEPVIIEMERHEEDLLIIGHASVIRCLLAYLIGLPASELPALEVARGDLIEVMPTSYGVVSHAFHFWDGPGRAGGHDETNFYENFAEDTMDKKPKVPL